MSSRLDSSQEDMGAYSSGDDAPSLGHSPNTSAKIEAGRQRVRATFLRALKGNVVTKATLHLLRGSRTYSYCCAS